MNEKKYFIFVFNEKQYEDEANLGHAFTFPESDRGGYKFKGKSTGSWGSIIDKVRINDKIIWTISGSSERIDKKTFWGHGEIIQIDKKKREWLVESIEFKSKNRIDEVINKMPQDYKELYTQSHGGINIGYFGTIQIDEFQYKNILDYCS